MITEHQLNRANKLKETIKTIKIILKDLGIQKNGESKGLHYSYKNMIYPNTSYCISDLYTEFIDKTFGEAIQNANDSLKIEMTHELNKLELEYHSLITKESKQ